MSKKLDLFCELGGFSVQINNRHNVHITEMSEDWKEKPSISNKVFHLSAHFQKINEKWDICPNTNPYFSVPWQTPEVTPKQKIRILEILKRELEKLEQEELDSFLEVEKEKHKEKIEQSKAKIQKLEQELERAKSELSELLAEKTT